MNANLTPNLNFAQAFLNLLDPGSTFTFQTFGDDKLRKNPRLAQVLHGTLEQHAQQLVKLQQQGAGVFHQIECGREFHNQALALGGQRDAPDSAHKQALVEPGFKRSNLVADRRWRLVQLGARRGEATQSRGALERTQCREGG